MEEGFDMTKCTCCGALVDVSSRDLELRAMMVEEVCFCCRGLPCHPCLRDIATTMSDLTDIVTLSVVLYPICNQIKAYMIKFWRLLEVVCNFSPYAIFSLSVRMTLKDIDRVTSGKDFKIMKLCNLLRSSCQVYAYKAISDIQRTFLLNSVVTWSLSFKWYLISTQTSASYWTMLDLLPNDWSEATAGQWT